MYSTQGKPWKSILAATPMMLLSAVLICGEPSFDSWQTVVSFSVTWLFFNLMFFLMLHSGKTDRYRAIVFITLAILFCANFMSNLVSMRGSVTFSNDDVLACRIPFCHIVSTMIIIPMALKGTIIFPGTIIGGFASITSMLVIVIGAMLALGRGFCSWGCFYGGWDDASSRLLKRPVIRKVNRGFRWGAWVVFVAIAIISALNLSPFYCEWLCPFKAVTEFEMITGLESIIKTIIFWSLFIGLAIVLPALTKKRIQCSSFCPMGALMSLTNHINVFNVAIDRESCIKCGMCEKNCPMLAIGHKDIEKGRASMSCSKCGKCIDKCTKQAIHYHIKGMNVKSGANIARITFLYAGYLFLLLFCSGYFQNSVNFILNLL